jgi:esterase
LNPTLAYTLVAAEPTLASTEPAPSAHAPAFGAVYYLHGILGSGGNLRALAKASGPPGSTAVLVDLRCHGRSQGFLGPHSVLACAKDVLALSKQIALPIAALVGHSFGGKVALEVRRLLLEQGCPAAGTVALDSSPGKRASKLGSEGTLQVLGWLRALPERFDSRAAFASTLGALGADEVTVAWLAMNVEAGPNGYRFRINLDAIEELLGDYFASDLWPHIAGDGAAAGLLTLVLGARSQVVSAADRAQAAAHAWVSVREVDAGHWVHVDAAEAVAGIVRETLRASLS